jgi:hypothetical protein
MVVDRSHAEEHEAGFALKPQLVSDKANVHMYLHHDGYPEWRGIELANWINHMQEYKGFNNFGDGSRIASHLVKDFHYNSQYLYPSILSVDHNYTYIIWTGKPDVWITCWNQYSNSCVFVSKIDDIIRKWSRDHEFDYTDWKQYKLNTNAK